MIPEAAVEAAVAAYLKEYNYNAEEIVSLVLEAAAPHMLAQAWDRAVGSMVYDDGTPVEIMSNNNPYRPAT